MGKIALIIKGKKLVNWTLKLRTFVHQKIPLREPTFRGKRHSQEIYEKRSCAQGKTKQTCISQFSNPINLDNEIQWTGQRDWHFKKMLATLSMNTWKDGNVAHITTWHSLHTHQSCWDRQRGNASCGQSEWWALVLPWESRLIDLGTVSVDAEKAPPSGQLSHS